MTNAVIGWYARSFDPSKASIRLRLLQPIRYLEEQGIKTEPFDERKGVAHYDAVIFSKSLHPNTLALARRVKALGKTVIFDICDNLFEGKEKPGKQMKVQRLRDMLQLADIVVFATATLQERIAGHVPPMKAMQLVIPDMLEDFEHPGAASLRERLGVRRLRNFLDAHPDAMHCVWFGKCQGNKSGLVHVDAAVRELEHFARSHKATLTIIGDRRFQYWKAARNWGVPHFYLPWALASFGPALQMHDVALIPLERNGYTVGKSINRPATAIRAGLGVIADSIPAYEELRPFIPLDDWQGGLSRYRHTHPRVEAGCEAARSHIATVYGPIAVGKAWMDLVRHIADMSRADNRLNA